MTPEDRRAVCRREFLTLGSTNGSSGGDYLPFERAKLPVISAFWGALQGPSVGHASKGISALNASKSELTA